IEAFFTALSQARGTRDELKTLLAVLGGDKTQMDKVSKDLKGFAAMPVTMLPGARVIAVEAAKDIGPSLGDIPDSSLASDWEYLCHEMRADLAQGPEK